MRNTHPKPNFYQECIHKLGITSFLTVTLLVTAIACDSNSEETDTNSTVAPEVTWDTYSAPEPTEEMKKILQVDSAIYPYQECIGDPELLSSVPPNNKTSSEGGSEELCVWHHRRLYLRGLNTPMLCLVIK